MINGLKKDVVHRIYDKTARYYNVFHNLGTLGQDEKGRTLLVEKTIQEGDYILDAGGGTGLTAIKALDRAGADGRVVILDISENMLAQARKIIERSGLSGRAELKTGDMYQIPYPDETFDSVLSSYSTCPLEDPINAVIEMLRVLKQGGFLGIAHSTESDNRVARFFSNKFEQVIWKVPRLSLGCRNISLAGDIRKLNVRIIEEETIGMVPFFFKILVLQKK